MEHDDAPTAASAANCEASTALTATLWRAPNENDAKPATSQRPDTTTNGTAAAAIRRRRNASEGSATTATPTARGGITAHTSGSAFATFAVANRPAPKLAAAPAARSVA